MKRSSAASGYLVKKSDTSNGYRLWITSTGAVQFDVLLSGTTKTVTSATTIPLNTWKHVAARYNGSELRVFIGGTIDTATMAATGSLAATTEALWMGYYDAINHHLNGYLDDVSIYDTALSDAEITKLSNNQMGRYEYHHTNALGSNIVLTDDNKNVLIRYEYDTFGAVCSETDTTENVRKFTGKEYESDVKLYYHAARYYDPYIGRFTQRDPAADGINWYAYAYNNPLAFIDPLGLRPVNDMAETALLFTFGDHMGSYLASIIDVQVKDSSFGTPGIVSGRVSYWTKTDIELSREYNLTDENKRLYSLSVFIHEATHIWQKQTKRHRGGTGGEDYNYTFAQLDSLNLKGEEHAEAVQDWFYVKYGLASSLLESPMAGWNELNLFDDGVKINKKVTYPMNTRWFLSSFLDAHYDAVINEIRDSSLMPIVALPNYPNPF